LPINPVVASGEAVYTAAEVDQKLADLPAGGSGGVTQADIDTAVQAAVDALVDGAPAALDTLRELADAVSDDDDAFAALTTAIGGKYTKPAAGIPASDFAPAVQSALTKATNSASLVVLASRAAYDALTPKVAGTVYVWPSA
jgi:acyl-CoA reductase-like NAD-dependent aldehyde dehydrogenase